MAQGDDRGCRLDQRVDVGLRPFGVLHISVTTSFANSRVRPQVGGESKVPLTLSSRGPQ